jgi:translation initiation factor 2B subunit (eIF-2B alpha/beta/delta family)
MNEGLILAKKLGEQGIKTNLIVDSAIFSFLPETDLIFVGADALSHNGLVNKIGTFGLALAAEKFDIDFYTLCGTEKILPYNYQSKKEKLKDSSEISKKSLKNVNIINYYFDLTPLNYLTGIITEEGVKSPNEIKQYIRSLRIHKNLIN